MKSFVLTGLNQMEMRDVPMPEIKSPADVLLKISAVGVCGSDIHYYKTGRIGSQVVQYPFTVGHESAAFVEKTGPAVKKVSPGTLVAVEPAMSCGRCDQCLANRPHTCRSLRFLGCPGQAEGCLCEYIVMPEECCVPVAEKITAGEAALSEPLAIGYYAAQNARPLKGADIAILGCGPIGLSVMICAEAMGAGRIFATDPIPERLAVAGRNGACWTGSPCECDVVEKIARAAPRLMDVVFECCGQQEAIDQAVDLLKPGGTLMLVGIPETDRVSLVIDKTRRKEICIRNVRRQHGCLHPALALMGQGRLKPGFMITHRFPFAKTREAFDLVGAYAGGVVKAMIDFAA